MLMPDVVCVDGSGGCVTVGCVPECVEVQVVVDGLNTLPEFEVAAVHLSDAGAKKYASAVSLVGARFGRGCWSRHGKWLTAATVNGPDVLAHLRLAGTIRVYDRASTGRHTHVQLQARTGDGATFVVALSDPRRFATWQATDDAAAVVAAKCLGPDVLAAQVTSTHLCAAASGRRVPVKGLLLDQTVVAGLGNYLVDEVLFAARVHPGTSAGAVSVDEWDRVVFWMSAIAAASLRCGGLSMRDYVHVDGSRGWFGEQLVAYSRAGQACVRCCATLTRLVVAGRTTTVCQMCTPPPSSLLVV